MMSSAYSPYCSPAANFDPAPGRIPSRFPARFPSLAFASTILSLLYDTVTRGACFVTLRIALKENKTRRSEIYKSPVPMIPELSLPHCL